MASPEKFTSVNAQGACAKTVETRQLLGAEAFEKPDAKQSRELWQNFHTSHPGLNSELDEPTKAALSKLETAALNGDAQTFGEIVKASQNDPSADGALRAFQRELSTLRKDSDSSGHNLFAQADGKLARITVDGGRVRMLDTGAITFNLTASSTPVDECGGKTQNGKGNGETIALEVGPGQGGAASVNAHRTDRFNSLFTDSEAFFSRFSPVLQKELEGEGHNLL